MEAIDLSNPEFYINRELSLLEFNVRVLAQALDESLPLLERLNYLCISCSNLDEFYEVRVASLLQMAEMDANVISSDGLTISEQLEKISVKAHALVTEQYRILNQVLIPRLEADNIRFLRRNNWTPAQRNWLEKYFNEELLPILTPV
ncbi:MAG: hypothetical protein RLZ92_917, partial [Pseudomonadota bacterium]